MVETFSKHILSQVTRAHSWNSLLTAAFSDDIRSIALNTGLSRWLITGQLELENKRPVMPETSSMIYVCPLAPNTS